MPFLITLPRAGFGRRAKRFTPRAALIPLLLSLWVGHAIAAIPPEVVDIAPVWAGHPVGFALLTHGDQQFVAYYDRNRQMTLAQRTLGSTHWKFKPLPTYVKWDSHNYIAMTLDPAGCLHISGNMHAVPLVYFRGTKPLDIDSVVPLNRMTGQNEKSATYPEFFNSPAGDLLFLYRDGRSGNGNNLINIYDPATQTWRRLLDQPLMDGGGKANAYMHVPRSGPDGWYHVSWVWRNTPDASTCHDLSYIRSRDLIHWETATGQPLTLPITLATPGVLVDPIPVKGGIVNGMGEVGFDAQNRVVLSYFKFDAAGHTQLYFARLENGVWKQYLASDWHDRIEFSGGGSLPVGVHVGPVTVRDGRLEISFSRSGPMAGTWTLDPVTLKLLKKVPAPAIDEAFAKFGKVESTFPDMHVKWAADDGQAADGKVYRLRWETLPAHRDAPRDPPYPPPSMLRVIGVAPPNG